MEGTFSWRGKNEAMGFLFLLAAKGEIWDELPSDPFMPGQCSWASRLALHHVDNQQSTCSCQFLQKDEFPFLLNFSTFSGFTFQSRTVT